MKLTAGRALGLVIDIFQKFAVKFRCRWATHFRQMQNIPYPGLHIVVKNIFRMDPRNTQKIALSPPLNRETASLPFTRVLRVLSDSRL